MNKKIVGIVSVLFIIICIAYIIFDIITGQSDQKRVESVEPVSKSIETNWVIAEEFEISFGELSSVAISNNGNIITAGKGFIAVFDSQFSLLWDISIEDDIYAIATYNNYVYAATQEEIIILNLEGDVVDRWGPYDEDAIITSIAVNENYIAIADAGNQLVFVLDKDGALESIAGHPGNQFIIPSAYFDVYLTEDNTLVVANTGKRNIEFRSIDGTLIRAIGEEGDDFSSFCGCCNPSHFSFTPDGNIVTAEKGINRIKIISTNGELIEPVAQPSNFMASLPLDISVSSDGKIYGANKRDSKIYVFQKLH